jgi:hypothetical protein
MEKIFEHKNEIEVKVGDSFVWWKRVENPKHFAVCRGEHYVEMKWNDLTLDEQKAVEKFN